MGEHKYAVHNKIKEKFINLCITRSYLYSDGKEPVEKMIDDIVTRIQNREYEGNEFYNPRRRTGSLWEEDIYI